MDRNKRRLESQLCKAVKDEDPRCVQVLLSQGASGDVVGSKGVAAVHLAVGRETEKSIRCLKLLLQRGADPNLRSSEGLTPLHVAVLWGCYQNIKLLLANGGNPNVMDQEGNTPGQLAEQQDNRKCAQLLQNHQARSADLENLPRFQYSIYSDQTDMSSDPDSDASASSRLSMISDLGEDPWSSTRHSALFDCPGANTPWRGGPLNRRVVDVAPQDGEGLGPGQDWMCGDGPSFLEDIPALVGKLSLSDQDSLKSKPEFAQPQSPQPQSPQPDQPHTNSGGYSVELSAALRTFWLPDCHAAEWQLSQQFDQPDQNKKWRDGLIKSSFNYLLLDPSVTKDLPYRRGTMSPHECFQTFVHAVFYVGKGTGSRPYSHLYKALKYFKGDKTSKKSCPTVQHILRVWGGGQGVILLHCFQNVIPVEAFTREACMIDAMGLEMLTNQKRGDYYGVVSTWQAAKRRELGVHLLYRAMQIFLAEEERQLRPADIKR